MAYNAIDDAESFLLLSLTNGSRNTKCEYIPSPVSRSADFPLKSSYFTFGFPTASPLQMLATARISILCILPALLVFPLCGLPSRFRH
jgi:hypothetical protein